MAPPLLTKQVVVIDLDLDGCNGVNGVNGKKIPNSRVEDEVVPLHKHSPSIVTQ
jgi:hypothetical protein